MNADTLNTLAAQWARSDRDFAVGYVAPASVLAQRLEGEHRKTLEAVIGSAFYAERAYGLKGRAFYVGLRDNRDPAACLTACEEMAKHLKAKGFRVTVRKPTPQWSIASLVVKLPVEIDSAAAEIHPAYTALLGTLRAELAK
jgi:hypothetical protein